MSAVAAGNAPYGFALVDRLTGHTQGTFSGPGAFRRACEVADAAPNTGYLSVCAMVATPSDPCAIEFANLRGLLEDAA